MHARIEAFEPRTLFTFAALDPAFGSGGEATLADGATSRPFEWDAPGALAALDEGGSLLRFSGREFRRYDERGRLVTSYGDSGMLVLNGKNAAIAHAFDAATGRLAIVARNGPGGAAKLNLYDGNGRLARGTRLAAMPDVGADARVTFDAGGTDVWIAAGDGARLVRIPLTPGGLSGGIDLPALPTGAAQSRLIGLVANPAGGVTVVRTFATANGANTDYYAEIARYDRAGKPVASFGTGGAVRIFTGYTQPKGRYGSYTKSISIDDVAAGPDGSVYLLERLGQYRDAYSTQATQLQQVRDDGTLAAAIDLSDRLSPLDGTARRLAFDGAGRPHVIGSGEVVRLTAKRRFDEGFNGNGAAAAIAAPIYAAAAFANDGRLIVAGNAAAADGVTFTPTMRAYQSRAAAGFATPAGSAVRLADGTLDVSGTSRADVVDVRGVGARKIEITVNGRGQTFELKRIRSIVIHTGAGDDRITVRAGRHVRVQAGAGVDLATGGDTIEGGSGDDILSGPGLILGGDGNDRLSAGVVQRGGAGDDTLAGGDAWNYLFGDDGDDVLWANDASGTNDFGLNFLTGGRGADRFVRSRHAEGQTLDVINDAGSDDRIA